MNEELNFDSLVDDYFLQHYGTPRKSGRYPWGSGEDPQQRGRSFLGMVDHLKKKGMSEVEIAKGLGMTTTQLRVKKSLAKTEARQEDYTQALKLKDKGYGYSAIGKAMGMNESSVRSLLNPAIKERAEMTNNTAAVLKKAVDSKGYIDVGAGVEAHLGVSRTKLKNAVAMLEEQGYKIHYVHVDQLGTGKKTSIITLGKPDSTYSEVARNKEKIKMVQDYSEDGGRSFLGLEPIRSVSGKRVYIRYDEDGGSGKDGVIELRRGVEDISLDKAKYAQVRIGVDDKYYMKVMAMYSDDIPKGYDMIYNTNKKKGTPPEKVYKALKDDPDNPFGATVRQKKYIGKDGKEKLSALNIVNEEGAWGEWSKTLSSQVVSKQSEKFAKTQLDLAYKSKAQEYAEIMKLTNPVVRKKMLETFANDCDSAAVHLKAAAMPRQRTQVILPFPEMKDTEIFAPNYRNGEKVVLIRYPHGGIFEIPELTVNNKVAAPKKTIGGAKDAVGINARVAERLSGADFDGDTVLVIPNNGRQIRNSAPLKGLKDFDPKINYKGYEGMPVISSKRKQTEMGKVSNLITDMTIKGAKPEEIARAVRHSMVVIDAEKHKLNYKQSFIDNGIGALKEKFQGKANAGASTLISRASSEIRVDNRKESIDPTTGKKKYTPTGETYTNAKGKVLKKQTTSKKMYEVEDAYDLVSSRDKGSKMEFIYADHANKLKSLANTSRKEMINTKNMNYSPTAKKAYAGEVAALKAQLNTSLKNKPLERQAQLLANAVLKQKRQANPNMSAEDVKKIKGQALAEARVRVGAVTPGEKKKGIIITDRQWAAIQAGAVSSNTLSQILNNTDLDRIKQLATPRTTVALGGAKLARAKAMLKSGYTQAEIADALGVSTTVITKIM